MPLLRTLLPKDLLDIAPDVLRDTWAHTPRPDGVPEGIWAAFVLCPRVGYEQLLPQRRELTTYFSEERSAAFRRDPAALWAWLTETIAPSVLSPSPLAALTLLLPVIFSTLDRRFSTRQSASCLRRSAARSASRPGLRRRTVRPNIGRTASGSARRAATRAERSF